MLFARKIEPTERFEAGLAESEKSRGERLNEFAKAALSGDAPAVRDFLREIAPLVRSVCRGVLGRGHPEIEDTIQDCLIDVVRALPQFRFESDVSHYLTKIALRRSIGRRKRAQARAKQHTNLDECDGPVTTFDDRREARADLVRSLLDDLDQSQATALRLRLMLGHSIAEIACMTGVSPNTVKTRLRLGKDHLRRRLQGSGEAPRAR